MRASRREHVGRVGRGGWMGGVVGAGGFVPAPDGRACCGEDPAGGAQCHVGGVQAGGGVGGCCCRVLVGVVDSADLWPEGRCVWARVVEVFGEQAGGDDQPLVFGCGLDVVAGGCGDVGEGVGAAVNGGEGAHHGLLVGREAGRVRRGARCAQAGVQAGLA